MPLYMQQFPMPKEIFVPTAVYTKNALRRI